MKSDIVHGIKYEGLELNNYKFDSKIHTNTTYYEKSKIGQLKLLLNEIDFIEWLIKDKKINPSPFQVAGGGPGIHYELLADMYPKIQFVLYDKTPFYTKLKDKSNITLKDKYVTNDLASNEFDKNGIFISDIRSSEIEDNKDRFNNTLKYETIILNDMYSQLNYLINSKCKYGLLKFKVPDTCTCSYIDGILKIQPFINTNELRLFVDMNINKKFKIYDGKIIDDTCQLINNYWRTTNTLNVDNKKIHEIIDSNKYLHYNWDNIALVDILFKSDKLNYLDKIINYYKLDKYYQ